MIQERAYNVVYSELNLAQKRLSIPNIIFNDSLIYDHINGNYKDNRKENLRPCIASQNMANRRKFKNCSSQYKGVSWYKRGHCWSCKIMVNGKRIFLGYFKSEIEAAKAYDIAAIKFHKEFARINFPAGK